MRDLKKGEKITLVIVALFIIGVSAWNLYFGIKGLFLTPNHSMEDIFNGAIWQNTYEGTIECVSNERLAFSRQIRYRWAGEEYYYIIFSKDRDKAMIVRASKNWLKDVGNEPFNQVSIHSTGIVRDLRYEVKERLKNTVAGLREEGIQVSETVYLDLLAKRICMVQLFVGISLIIVIAYYCLLLKKLVSIDEKPVAKPLLFLMIAWTIVLVVAFIYLRNKTW